LALLRAFKHKGCYVFVPPHRRHSLAQEPGQRVPAASRLAANVALARKLAQLFYRLLRYGAEYVENGLKASEAKVLQTEAWLLRKLAKKQGFMLVPDTAK
jgi:hypothetical protein